MCERDGAELGIGATRAPRALCHWLQGLSRRILKRSLALEQAMTRILFVVSSAREIVLADGSSREAGVFAAEALKPYDRFATAGMKVAFATADGQPP
jgi:hypothetical protein